MSQPASANCNDSAALALAIAEKQQELDVTNLIIFLNGMDKDKFNGFSDGEMAGYLCAASIIHNVRLLFNMPHERRIQLCRSAVDRWRGR